jgi:hypothetical protein
MDTETIKAITDAGLGFGALIALVFVIIKQLDILKTTNDNIAANTEVTKELTSEIGKFREVNQEVANVIKGCPKINQK